MEEEEEEENIECGFVHVRGVALGLDGGATRVETRKEAKLFSPAKKTRWAVMHSGAPAEGYARLKGILMAALIMHSEAKSDMAALCRNLRSFYVFSYLGSVIPSDVNHLACVRWRYQVCDFNLRI